MIDDLAGSGMVNDLEDVQPSWLDKARGYAGQTIKNIPSSAANFATNVGTALTHPAETGMGIVRGVSGGVGELANKMAPGLGESIGVTPEDTDAFDGMKNFMIQRYGSLEALKQTVKNDPVGFAADLSAALGGGASALGKAGEVSGISGISGAAGTLTKASELSNPVNFARGAARFGGEFVAKPIVKGLEGLSGIQGSEPGTLVDEFKDPGLITSPGVKSVSRDYEAAKSAPIREGFVDISDKKDLVDAAIERLKQGDLSPEEGLAARKALEDIKNRVSEPYFRDRKSLLNQQVKPTFGEQDIARSRGLKAEAMRNVFPINKDGGASIGRTFLTGLAGGAAAHFAGINPAYAIAISPYAQGIGAGLLGTAAKAASPVAEMLIKNPELAAILDKSNQLGLVKKK